MNDEDGVQINELAFVVLHLGIRKDCSRIFRSDYSSRVQRIEVPEFVSSLSLSQPYAKNGIILLYRGMKIEYLF